ncbi:MAG: hypothetical protein RUDDFDWM_000863 [Candidatus Fervidibacterota bacterium]
MRKHLYEPMPARIIEVIDETPDVKTFTLQVEDGIVDYRPGQFAEVSVFGVGEAPFGISSSPTWTKRTGYIQVTVRAVGKVTRALHNLKVGEYVGVRAPLGNGFPVEKAEGKRVIIVGGGIGLPPLRSLLNYMLDNRERFGKITVLYGARTPADMVFKRELAEWSTRPDVEYLDTVDIADEEWQRLGKRVGVVTTLFPILDEQSPIEPHNTVAFICGPPIMIHFVILELEKRNVPPENIISTLERHMKCGVGKCGHCAIGHKYVCVDGPVFSWAEMKELEWMSAEKSV